jgi:hypothetical protein
MKYVYEGPGPQEDPELGLVKPGDEREFDAEPSWGPWRCIQPEPAETPQEPPPLLVDPPAPETPPAASTAPAAGTLRGI